MNRSMSMLSATKSKTMENELNQLLALLGGDNGTLAQVIAWIGAARVPLKIFSGKLQNAMERAISRVTETEDPEDDELVAGILSSKPYRIGAFVLDWIFSVKLPLKLNG